MTKIIIYSGLVWNGIWSHSHELAKGLAGRPDNIVKYFNVVSIKDTSRPNLCETADYKIPDKCNLEIVRHGKIIDNFGILYMIYTQLWSFFKFFQLRNEYDVLIVYNVYDWLVFFQAKMFGKKVVFMYADDYPELTPNILFKGYLTFTTWLFTRFSDTVVCTAKVLYKKAGKVNNEVYYLPNCVNMDDYREYHCDLESGNKNKKFIVGFLGNLGKWVDIYRIMLTAKHFENDDDIEFWIIGEGERYYELKQLIKKNHVSNMKMFGYVSHDKVYQYLNQFDVAIIPFIINKISNSVSPVKLFEYWLYKLPVIVSRTEELKQFTDVLLFADSSVTMTEWIQLLRNNDDKLKEIGKNGFNLVKYKYNWKITIMIYEKLLRRGD